MDEDNKRSLKHNASSLLEDKIKGVVKGQSANSTADGGTNVIRNMGERLRDGKLWRKRADNGILVKVRDTWDLASFFTKCQDNANIADMEITCENRYFVLYKKTNGMFPAVEDTNCKNWDEIDTKPFTSAPSGAVDIVTATGKMAVGVAEMTKELQSKESAKVQRRDVINHNALPNEVKQQYLKRLAGIPIQRSDIFTGNNYRRKMYKNDYTADLTNGIGIKGVERDMLFIEFQIALGMARVASSPRCGIIGLEPEDTLYRTSIR